MLLLATKVWEQRELGQLMEIGSVKRIHMNEWKNTGVPFFRARDIVAKFNNKKISDPIYISEETYNSNILKSGKVKKGQLLITGVGTIGIPYLITDDSPLYFKDGNVIWLKNNNYDGNFIFYFFTTNLFKNYLFKITGTGTVGTYTIENAKKTPISTPQINEQIKIGKLFNILENLLALYAKKSSCLDSCIAYFIRILYDDPQFFKQKNVQNSIIKSFKLDDILIKNNAKNKDLSILNVESISNKKGFISQKEQFDNYQVASKDLSNYYVIHPKDFAYNPSRINVGSIAYKSPNDVKGIVSPLYVSFKCKNDIVLDKYLWHWFKSTNFEHQRVRLSEGGVRDILSFNQLSKMKISIPSFEIQRQTINLLEILIQYKEEVDLKLNNLKLIKNTLLQSMFL